MKRVALTAYYDDQSGELVSVKYEGRFRRESALMRADVLQELVDLVAEQGGVDLADAMNAMRPPC